MRNQDLNLCTTLDAGFPSMTSDRVVSGLHRARMNLPESVTELIIIYCIMLTHGISRQTSIRNWLSTTLSEEDAKHEPLRDTAEPFRRNPSGDDDLALGVEASLYGKQGVRTVQDFLRWSRSSPALSRWNSFSSAASGHSGPLSVMDILNLWNDDPEEFLLDMGFGCDEPDLSGRIPARFINHQSQARGINLQVFLEAQKNRLDLENPDVSNRFRQLEVLQQVTTAFTSLMGSSSSNLKAPLAQDIPPEAREKRKRMGMLLRRASKQTLSQIHHQRTQDHTTQVASESLPTSPGLGDKKVPLKRFKPAHVETVCLSPLAEEHGTGPEPQSQPHMVSFIAHDRALRPVALREGQPLTATTVLQRKKSPCQARESFEMEEIHSFDDGSVTGSYTGGTENLVRGLIRTNSCQSDSSGFLEEPFIPSLPQQGPPGPDLIKALSGLSGGSTDSHSSERPGSPSPSFPQTGTSPPLASSPTSTAVEKPLASSTCPSPELSSVFGPSQPCHLTSDLQSKEMATPPKRDQSDHVSLPALMEYLPTCSSSELHIQTHSQSPTLSSLVSFTSLLPSSLPLLHASLSKRSDQTVTEDMDAPCPHLSTLPHDCEGTVSSTFFSVPPAASSPSTSPNMDCPFSIAISSESLSLSSGNTHSECTDMALHKTPSVSHSDIIGGSETSTGTPSHSQLDKNNPSASSSLGRDSSRFQSYPTSPSHNSSIPVCQSVLSPQSQDPDNQTDLSAGRNSDRTELHRPAYTDPAPTSPVQNVIHNKMDDMSLHTEDTFQKNENSKGDCEEHSEAVQTQDSVVYISDTEISGSRSKRSRLVSGEICNQPEINSQVPSCSLQDDTSAETKQEVLREVFQMEMNGTENELPKRILVLRNENPESSKMKQNPIDLIEIESLDMVFETSVDGSESENTEADAFFQQLDTECQVFWAEPILISRTSSLLEESNSFEVSDEPPAKCQFPSEPGDSVLSTGKIGSLSLLSLAETSADHISRNEDASSDAPSSLAVAAHQSLPTPDLKPLNRSVSVQMSSSPSSHIVHRKDVPYTTDSKCTLPSSILPLDTSTPFRAVQSWTDLHIQRNTLNKNLSQEVLGTGKFSFTANASEKTQRPTQMFSSTPSFPLLSNDWQTRDCLPGMASNYRTVSVSVDTGLWPHKEKEVDRIGCKDETKLWECNEAASIVCCPSCDHQCTCCTLDSYNKQQTLENIPYSLDELEEMMLCLQQFCSVLSNMEEQLSEDQAAVYSALSDLDREKVREIEELRRAVKQEARELEKQLNELAHHYDDSLKMKMHRLLDEQSLLCSQLKVFLPGASSPAPNKTVATQCCLMPWTAPADGQSGHVSTWSTKQSPPVLESISEGLGSSPTKGDKMDIVGFLQRLKDSLRHSVNTDSLE